MVRNRLLHKSFPAFNVFNETFSSAADQNCKSSRVFRVGPGSGSSLSKRFGPVSGQHTKFFSQERTLLSVVVTVEAIELIKFSTKMINCELFSHE